MHTYETKIINRSGDISLQVSADHLSDLAAIRAARKICGLGEIAEVWRGDSCVYSERAKPMRLVWPAVSGKSSA